MANIGERLAQPEASWRRYDDSIGLIQYEGTWQSNMPNASSWMGTRHISSNLPDKVIKFVFKGTKLRLLVNSASNRSENSTISIDGEIHTFSSRFTTTLTIAPTRLAFEKTDLVNDYHTVIISDTTTDYIDIDAIDIDEDGELVRYDYLDNLDTPELIRKYGLVKFGFDEDSGNALDEWGSDYIGTVSGAIRQEGWDGKGYSLYFNGSSVVNTNVGINSDAFTIRLKFKSNSTTNLYMYMLGTLNTFASHKGFALALSGTNATVGAGALNCGITSAANVFVVPQYTSFEKYNDGKWHDLALSWDGNSGSLVNLYIDDMSKPYIALRATSAYNGSSYNLSIGRLPAITTSAFIGSIDDVEIYAKALTSEELSNLKVGLESLNGKIYSLPNKEGKLREFIGNPTDGAVKGGYKWDDIESAVDSEYSKLDVPTTEYEIYNNSKATLGDGFIFNTPVSNFKTIKIEDNY